MRVIFLWFWLCVGLVVWILIVVGMVVSVVVVWVVCMVLWLVVLLNMKCCFRLCSCIVCCRGLRVLFMVVFGVVGLGVVCVGVRGWWVGLLVFCCLCW